MKSTVGEHILKKSGYLFDFDSVKLIEGRTIRTRGR